jgi:hypothetical protein
MTMTSEITVTAEAIAFFREYGGYSVATGETDAQGRERSAREMAAAEAWLVAQPGFQVRWVQDNDYNPDDYDIDDMPDVAFGCVVKVDGEESSLWGITFDGPGPEGSPYARIVVAELAAELMP